LRTVIDSLAEGVIAVDSDQRIILAGGAACRMFGLTEGTALGRPIWELVRNPQLQEWIVAALKQPMPIHGEMQIHTPKARILAMSVARLAGQPAPGAVVVAHDITEIRRLEKVRQEFVANASHELKTPITSIRAYVETLLNGAIDDVEHRMGFLNTIDEQAGRLDATVRDLLTLAHIEADGAKPPAVPTDVATVVNRCKEHHRPAADRKNVSVTLQPPETPVIVAIGNEALETILSNLIDNAIKYTPEQGSVTVSWSAEESRGLIVVEDTGIGIPQKHLDRIFERFYRVDRGRSRDQGGTGLGLAIVKHLVQSAAGTIEISSQIGRGTKFSLRFPLPPRS
jgi:two-component system phosphate regulon sensor histidine kinase PhoR